MLEAKKTEDKNIILVKGWMVLGTRRNHEQVDAETRTVDVMGIVRVEKERGKHVKIGTRQTMLGLLDVALASP